MVSIGPRIQIAGEPEFRASLNRIISGVKELDSEMNLLVSSFSKWDSKISQSKQKTELLTKTIDEQKNTVSKYENAVQMAATKVESRRQALERAIATHKSAIATYGEESNEATRTGEAVGRASKAYENSQATLEVYKTKLNESKIALIEYQNQLKELPNNLQIIGQSMQDFGDKMVGIGEKLTKYVTAPLGALAVASVKGASDFEDGMAKIYTIATEGQIPMETMKQQLIDLSNATGYGLDDLAEATYQAVSASVDAAEAVEFLGTAANLARGGFTTTTRSVDLLTTVINAYGMEASKATDISDILLKTQNDGKTIIDELAGSMGTVIPTAANYNISLEQLAGAYATMTKQGVNTARATTFMNAMFTELEKGSSAVAEILDLKTKKTFAQLMDEGYSLADVLKILYDAVDQDTESFQRLFGNIRSGKAAAALINDDFKTLTDEIWRMEHATGQTSYALKVLETPSLKAKRALNELKNTSVDIGTVIMNEMMPTFQKIVDVIHQWTTAFAELDPNTKQMIINMGLLAAAAGPVLTVGGKIISGIGSVLDGSTKLILNIADFSKYLGQTVPLFGTIGTHLASFATYLPGILGVVAAYTALGVAAKTGLDERRAEIEAQWGLNEELRTSVETIHGLSDEYLNNIKSIQENRDATFEQTFYAQKLVEEYNKLVEANGLVDSKNREHADFILNELAEALGIERENLLELIEDNGKFGESVQNTIQDIRERAEAAALEEMYSEAIRVRTQAELELEKQEQALQAQQELVTKAQDDYNIALENYQKYYDAADSGTWHYRTELDKATDALGFATGAQIELEQSIGEATKTMEEADASAEFYAKKISGEVTETVDDATTAVKEGGKDIVSETENIGQDALSSLKKADSYSSGKHFVDGFTYGIRDYAWQAASQAYAMSSAALHSLNAGIQVASPSKLAYKSGAFFGEGFINGIDAMRQEAMDSANLLGDAALFGLGTVDSLTQSAYKTVNAPISLNVTVNGNVDDPQSFTRDLADNLAELLTRESEVFA